MAPGPTSEPTPSRWAFRFTAMALGLLVAWGLAEIGLRLLAPQPTGPSHLTADPELGVTPKPNHAGTVRLPGIYTYSFQHDARGFRVTPTASGDTTRPEVLLLGDSFAYGMGVENDETIASQLALRLGARGMPARVQNGARIGRPR